MWRSKKGYSAFSVFFGFVACLILVVSLPSPTVGRDSQFVKNAWYLASVNEAIPGDNEAWNPMSLPGDIVPRHAFDSATLKTYWIKAEFTLTRKTDAPMQVLFPQLLHGGTFYLNGHRVASIKQSDSHARVMWYQPYLLDIPAEWLHIGQNTIAFRLASYEPRISLQAMLIGPDNVVTDQYQSYFFWSKSLTDATNLLCLIAGILFLSLWQVAKDEPLYQLGGATVFAWGILYNLALVREIPVYLYFPWRCLLYIATAALVLSMTRFALQLCEYPMTPGYYRAQHIVAVMAPALFLLLRWPATPWLDTYWVAIMLGFYIHALSRLALVSFRQSQPMCQLLLGQSILCLVFAAHDYAVQAGLLARYQDILVKLHFPELLVGNIYLSHLSIPMLLFVVGAILVSRQAQNVSNLMRAKENLERAVVNKEHQLQAQYKTQQQLERVNAAHAERQRIIRDLHDGVNSQLLLGFSMASRGTGSVTSYAAIFEACLDEIRLIIDTAYMGQEVDLTGAVAHLCHRMQPRFETLGINLTWVPESDSSGGAMPESNLEPRQLLQILRIVQECLSNTLKYAKASEVQVSVKYLARQLKITVHDNGQGFEIGTDDQRFKSKQRGITNMKKRAQQIAAGLEISSSKDGTKIHLFVPYQSNLKAS